MIQVSNIENNHTGRSNDPAFTGLAAFIPGTKENALRRMGIKGGRSIRELARAAREDRYAERLERKANNHGVSATSLIRRLFVANQPDTQQAMENAGKLHEDLKRIEADAIKLREKQAREQAVEIFNGDAETLSEEVMQSIIDQPKTKETIAKELDWANHSTARELAGIAQSNPKDLAAKNPEELTNLQREAMQNLAKTQDSKLARHGTAVELNMGTNPSFPPTWKEINEQRSRLLNDNAEAVKNSGKLGIPLVEDAFVSISGNHERLGNTDVPKGLIAEIENVFAPTEEAARRDRIAKKVRQIMSTNPSELRNKAPKRLKVMQEEALALLEKTKKDKAERHNEAIRLEMESNPANPPTWGAIRQKASSDRISDYDLLMSLGKQHSQFGVKQAKPAEPLLDDDSVVRLEDVDPDVSKMIDDFLVEWKPVAAE